MYILFQKIVCNSDDVRIYRDSNLDPMLFIAIMEKQPVSDLSKFLVYV